MQIKELINWLKNFEKTICENKKVIRGSRFSGVRIELMSDGSLSIYLSPSIRGKTIEQRAKDFIRGILHDNNRELFVDLDINKLESIVRGEYTLKDEDYTWSDEE